MQSSDAAPSNPKRRGRRTLIGGYRIGRLAAGAEGGSAHVSAVSKLSVHHVRTSDIFFPQFFFNVNEDSATSTLPTNSAMGRMDGGVDAALSKQRQELTK